MIIGGPEQDEQRRGRHWLFAPFCLAALALIILLATDIGFIKHAEHWTSDWRTALLSQRLKHQHPDVALVTITEDTLAGSKVRLPLDRSMIADLVERIARAEPAAIGLDIVFLRDSEPDVDRRLKTVLRDAKIPIVLGTVDERAELPARQLEYHRRFLADIERPHGHVFFDQRTKLLGISDRVVREMAVAPSPAQPEPSFALALARTKNPDAQVRSRRIAWLLPPRSGEDTFLEIEAQSLLGPSAHIHHVLEALKGKVVLIGTDLADIDRHLTPLSVLDERRMAGVRIHAQITAQLIDDARWLLSPPPFREWLWLLLLATGAYLATRYTDFAKHRIKLAWLGSVVLVLIGFAAFYMSGVVMPYASGLAAWVGGISLGHRVDKVHRAFTVVARFVQARGLLQWRTYHGLGSSLLWRYWRERL